MRRLMHLPLALALTGGMAAAQAPPPAPAESGTAAMAPVDTFTYNPEGRRDPFVSLLARGTERRPGGSQIEGVAGMAVDELSVRGIVTSRGGYVAMVQGPDSKTYLLRANDKLLDGTVKAITAQGVVILQDVNDPLSLVKQKEVRKMLHGNEEGK
jgi:type IV pilus assembly protein PilP